MTMGYLMNEQNFRSAVQNGKITLGWLSSSVPSLRMYSNEQIQKMIADLNMIASVLEVEQEERSSQPTDFA